jgi:leucyl-tRNA synthetase
MRSIYDKHQEVKSLSAVQSSEEVLRALNKLINNMGSMFENLKMNTAVSEVMIFMNTIKESKEISISSWRDFLKVLAPLAPFLAEELWQDMSSDKTSVHLQPWPEVDTKYLEEDTVTIPIQVNGKVRTEITFDRTLPESEVRKLVLENSVVVTQLGGKEPKKIIYVPSRIVNIVL